MALEIRAAGYSRTGGSTSVWTHPPDHWRSARSASPSEQNLHLHRVQLVLEDLLDAIDERADKDGQSPDAVVREALSNYLDSA